MGLQLIHCSFDHTVCLQSVHPVQPSGGEEKGIRGGDGELSRYCRISELTQDTTQPYLDSEISNRFFDFGEDTIVRTDQYAPQQHDNRPKALTLPPDMSALRPIVNLKTDGCSRGCR